MVTGRPTVGRSRTFAVALLVSLVGSACGDASTTPGPATVQPSGSPAAAATIPAPSSQALLPSGEPAPSPSSEPAPSPSPAPAAEPLLPSRQDLIAAALSDGRIDYPTSLRYRAAALFDLPALPAELADADSRGDDSAVFEEIVALLPTLSAADQAILQPFIVRPTEPGSIFATAGISALTASIAGGGADPLAAATTECRDWVDSGSASQHFKVWACIGTDAAAGSRDVAGVAALLDELWGPMTKAPPSGMGPPIADASGPGAGRELGGDGRIDVYLLVPGESVHRSGQQSLPATSLAGAVPSPPYTDAAGNTVKTSSGFMLVNRARLADRDDLRRDLIHEFFHVLQKAHNRLGPLRGEDHHWFGEASAVWAETYYFRPGSADPHTWFSAFFQLSPAGLEAANPQGHDYASYIWPFFMEQESGAAAVFKAWVGIEAAAPGDFKAVSAAISAQLPFTTRFRDFAVRNLNRDLSPRSPPDKRYVDLDRNFPDGVQPVPIEAGVLTRNGRYQAAVAIEPLAARYFYFSPDFDARDVTFDLSGLSPPAVVDGDVLLHIAGRWERRPIRGSELRLCRDDRADDFDAAYLVLSDHDQDARVTGDLQVRTRGSCGDLAGTITWSLTYEYSDPQLNNAHTLTTDTVSISVRFAGATGEWVDDGSSYAWGGTGLTTDYVDDCARSTDNFTTVGGGPFDGEVASILVDVDRAAKTVFVSATVAGQLNGHKVGGSHVGSPGSGQCEIREEDYQQGGGSSVDSRAEWIQLVRCDNFADGVTGKISDDGRTVDFACASTRTYDVNTGTATETFTVTGALAFRTAAQ